MNQELAPFSCQNTPNVPELLNKLSCTLVLSTYQAGKVIFLSAVDDNKLVQLPRTFDKAMGVAIEGDKLAIATKNEVLLTINSRELAKSYPPKPNTYDALFVPRATYYTGQVDIHDLHWGENGILFAVNTSFSCICEINSDYSFKPIWHPPFITEMVSEDRCHLNGLALENGRPKYVSALGTGNTPREWKAGILDGGVVFDVTEDKILADKLSMPHSPMIIDDELYLLESAKGSLSKINRSNGQAEPIKELGCFVRGMAKIGDFLFIGTSKLRQNSSIFKDLPIASQSDTAGLKILHLPTLSLTAEITYGTSVDEIYDVQILENTRRPNILNTDKDVHQMSLAIPGKTFWARQQEKEEQAQP
ncbi:TIGR03032 family protein [bacterium AH-315-C07]|nr:TIGR03032 family protein [bacterium AH-315-C07]